MASKFSVWLSDALIDENINEIIVEIARALNARWPNKLFGKGGAVIGVEYVSEETDDTVHDGLRENALGHEADSDIDPERIEGWDDPRR